MSFWRTACFLIDTAFVYALINPRDQWHERAFERQRKIEARKFSLSTTEFILAEIGDGLSTVNFRRDAARAIHILQKNPYVEIIPASSELFARALDLYEQRQDKTGV